MLKSSTCDNSGLQVVRMARYRRRRGSQIFNSWIKKIISIVGIDHKLYLPAVVKGIGTLLSFVVYNASIF